MPSPVKWGQRPSKRTEAVPPSVNALDAFVRPVKPKRLNLNIPANLHARIKAQCALEGREMTEALIELLEARFPAHK